jgi:hypothetical protein
MNESPEAGEAEKQTKTVMNCSEVENISNTPARRKVQLLYPRYRFKYFSERVFSSSNLLSANFDPLLCV